jgi:hypothetical protein
LEDLDLEPSGDGRLLRPNVSTRLKTAMNQKHRDFHHIDIIGADGIELFCPDRVMRNTNVKRLQTELQKIAKKNGKKKKNQDNEDYHHMTLFRCHIFCPEKYCPDRKSLLA